VHITRAWQISAADHRQASFPEAPAYNAGVDWGGAAHAVCVLDETGGVVARFAVRHDA
jgi:hypothetical protein